MKVVVLAIAVMVVVIAAWTDPAPTTAASRYIAADHFGRVVSNGWGHTDPGGPYSVDGTPSDYWVSTLVYARGLGYMRVPSPGISRGVRLMQARAINTEVRFSAFMNAPASSGPYYMYAVARSSGSNEFRARVVYNRDCTVATSGSIVINAKEQQLGAPVRVAGMNWCGGSAGRVVSLRAQVTGTNPTTVRIKAWSANPGVEPSTWLWSATSTTGLASAPAAVGLRSYASSGGAKVPVTFAFYNWFAEAL